MYPNLNLESFSWMRGTLVMSSTSHFDGITFKVRLKKPTNTQNDTCFQDTKLSQNIKETITMLLVLFLYTRNRHKCVCLFS